jgi:transaldolase
MSTDRLGDLAAAGVSIWLDDLSRERLTSGNLQSLITDRHVVGVTTNPTIFAAALSHGESYDTQVHGLAERGASVEEAVREITVGDVQQACDVFSGTWETTGGVDGRVSLEVDPRLARDTDATVAEAKDLWKAVDRPNLLVKIPATEAGLPAITSALAEGISVNVTLIFSVERYRAVMGAYLDGLEQAAANGQTLAGIASVASFFVSRVDTEIDKRLETIGTDEALALRGKAAVANSRLAYAAFQEVFSGPRWEALATQGARAQRPLWASTGVKNPEYSDTLYVSDLVVSDTVNTMPEKTLLAFADHGELHPDNNGDAVTGTAAQAQQVFDAVAAVGVDLTDVFLVLENEGVEKFDKSWTELLETVRGQLDGAKK